MARIIKRYDSSGTLIGEINPSGAKFALGFMGGCLGGSVGYEKDLRQPWDLSEGDRLEFLTDDSTPCYTGFVSKPKRGLADSKREYELKKPWDFLANVNIPADLVLGYQSEDHGEVGTIKEAVQYLLDNYIADALPWLSETYSLITDAQDKILREFRIQAGTD